MNADGLRQLAVRFLPPDGQQDVEKALAAGKTEAVRRRFRVGMECDIDHGFPPGEAERALLEVDGLLSV